MSEDAITLDEKRMYGETRPETHAYVASGLGLTRVETAGGQIGRFTLEHRCDPRDIAGANGEIAVATDDAVLVATADGFAATGFGPATAVGYDDAGLVATGEDRVARYDGGEWWEMGSVADVRALSADLLAAAGGVYGLPGCAYLGLHDAADVAGPFAATADGLYERDPQAGTVGARENWAAVRSGAHGAVATDGERVHAADADSLVERRDGDWRDCDLPVRERVVDVTHGKAVYAVTEDGTVLVETVDEATADGRGGWRSRSLGLPEVVGVAVA